MMLSGHYLFKAAFIPAIAVLLLLAFTSPAGADSVASLNVFGFPALGSGNSLSGMPDATSANDVISASSISHSPSNQFTGYFGTGLNGIQMGESFGFPVASHDASTVAFAKNVAFEATRGNDAIAFPDIDVNTGSAFSSFPTIKSANSDVKYMENTQFQLSTESDTTPMANFNFPGFFGSFL